jgi:hypothetical protein
VRLDADDGLELNLEGVRRRRSDARGDDDERASVRAIEETLARKT